MGELSLKDDVTLNPKPIHSRELESSGEAGDRCLPSDENQKEQVAPRTCGLTTSWPWQELWTLTCSPPAGPSLSSFPPTPDRKLLPEASTAVWGGDKWRSARALCVVPDFVSQGFYSPSHRRGKKKKKSNKTQPTKKR